MDTPPPNDSQDPVARLLQRVGKRPEPTPESAARIRAQVHAAWRTGIAERGRQRVRQRVLALAASVLVVLGAAWWIFAIRDGFPAAVMARIENADASLRIERHGRALTPRAGLDSLSAGDRLLTGTRGATLRQLPQGATTLRLGSDSVLEWQAPDRVRLARGRLYVDTGADSGAKRSAALLVQAAQTRIEHIGTQFMTQVDGEQVEVSVRDGLVRIQSGDVIATLTRGERGQVHAFGQIERSKLGSSSPAWNWVDALAPALPIEGRSLREVLLRLAYDAGLTLTFASAQIETAAAATLLHGPALALPPREALQAVLATTSFIATSPVSVDAGDTAPGSTDELRIDAR